MTRSRSLRPKNPGPPSPQARLTVRVPIAAAMLGIGRTKLYELIGAGEIETIKVGRITLIAMRALEDFVERQSRASAPPTANAPKRRGRPRISFVQLSR